MIWKLEDTSTTGTAVVFIAWDRWILLELHFAEIRRLLREPT